MSEVPSACYVPVRDLGPRGGDLFESTRLSAASWYPDGQHGGVVAALMARAVARRETLVPMEVARVTVELFRIVPVTRVEVVVETVREGKRIQSSQISLYGGDTELARGLVQRLRIATLDLETHIASPRLQAPDQLRRIPFVDVMPIPKDGSVSFGRNAVEVAQESGSFSEPGPATVWFRIHKPLVDGEEMTPLERAVISADFLNGMTRLGEPSEVAFMNSDLTVQLARYPRGEWVALSGESLWDSGGRGSALATLHDEHGPFGTAGQTLFLESRS